MQAPHVWNDPDLIETDSHMENRFLRPFHDPREGSVVRIAPDVATACTHLFQSFSERNQLQPGKTYRWSVRIKTRKISEDSSGQPPYPIVGQDQGAVLGIDCRTAIGYPILQKYVLRVVGTHDWQTYSGVITVPADTASGDVFVGVRRASGEALFDKVSFKPQDGDTEWLVNGDFEKFTKSPLVYDHWWIDDPSVLRAHWRHFCRQFHVGDDVVARYFKLAIAWERPPASVTNGQPFQICAADQYPRHAILRRSASCHGQRRGSDFGVAARLEACRRPQARKGKPCRWKRRPVEVVGGGRQAGRLCDPHT